MHSEVTPFLPDCALGLVLDFGPSKCYAHCMGEKEPAPVEIMSLLDEEQRAQLKFFILDSRYWSFYPIAFDGKDTLFGLVVSPNRAELGYQSIAELQWVKAELDLEIERDLDFVPTPLRELLYVYQGKASD